MLTKTARFSFSFILICLLSFASSFSLYAQEHRLRSVFTFPVLNISEDPRELSSIVVKLNDHDISLFARLQPGFVQINLPTPLKPGAYDIFIQATFTNGDVNTLLQKQFVLNELKQGSGKPTFNLKPGYTFAIPDSDVTDSKLERKPSSRPADSAAIKNSSDIDQMLPLMKFDSKDEDHEEANRGFIRTGDHLIDQQGLLFSNYHRNGLSAGISDNTRQYQAQVFAFQESHGAEQENFLPTPKKQERSVGALASYSPLTEPELFTIATAYLRGEKSETAWDSQNVDQEQKLYGGDNWNVSMDSRILNKALMLKSEYAWSAIDNTQTASTGFYERNSAWKTSAEWHAPSKKTRWLFNEWRLGLEVQEIEPEFWSLGNLNLPADLHSEKLYFVGSYSDFNLTAEMIREQNNVDANPLLPDQQAGFLNLNWYFTPSSLDARNPFWNLFGQPSFNGHANFSDQNQDDEDILLAGYDLDRKIDEYHISANFHKTNWNWSLQHSQTFMDDRSSVVKDNGIILYEPPSDSVNYLTGLTLGVNPTDYLHLNFLVQLNLLKEEQSGNEFSNLNFGVDSRIQLVPEKWSLNLNYSINENDNRFNDEFNSNSHYRDQSINLLTELNMLKPKAISPGINVFFKGSYLHQEETTSNDTDEHYKVLIGCSLYWNKSG